MNERELQQMIGGTSWLFARPEMDQKLDYLFVDEAGQMRRRGRGGCKCDWPMFAV